MFLFTGNHTILIFFNTLLMLHVGLLLGSFSSSLSNRSNITRKRVLGSLLFLFIVLLVGLRPISGQYFGDMSRYSMFYWDLSRGYDNTNISDIGFLSFMKFTTVFANSTIFFVLSFILYAYPLYISCKKLFGPLWYYGFLILVSSFSFFSYGTNGIRNGIATSIMILALTYCEKRLVFLGIALIAVSFHKSLLIVLVAYAFTQVFNNNKLILFGWIISVPMSLLMSGFLEVFLAEHLISDDKAVNYLLNKGMDYKQTNIGFRWDFILYSASGVFAGWYFIIKRGFNDKVYSRLFNIYLICNAIWILIIKVPFSNRFAYLSWFMLGLVIVYPFLKQEFFKNQHVVLTFTMVLYFSFTYLMNIILG